MQVNDERLKEFLTDIAKDGQICPKNANCQGMPTVEKCVNCLTEHLKQPIW